MLRLIVYFEDYRNLWIKAVDVQRREIRLRVEDETINSIRYLLGHQEEWFHSSIVICPGVTKFSPGLVSVLYFKTNRYATGWCATRSVENVS